MRVYCPQLGSTARKGRSVLRLNGGRVFRRVASLVFCLVYFYCIHNLIMAVFIFIFEHQIVKNKSLKIYKTNISNRYCNIYYLHFNSIKVMITYKNKELFMILQLFKICVNLSQIINSITDASSLLFIHYFHLS